MLRETIRNASEKARIALLPVSTAVMVAVPTLSAWAAESDAAFDVQATATAAIDEVKTLMLFVIAAGAAAGVAVSVSTVGVDYVIKRIKTLKKAG